MQTATFILKHEKSGSRVFVEFILDRRGKVHIADIAFATGNVVSLNTIRDCMAQAKEYLGR